MENILNNIQIGILEFDKDYNCIYINKYMKEYNETNKIKHLSNISEINSCYYYELDPDININVKLDMKFLMIKTDELILESICKIININTIGYKWYKINRILNINNDNSISFIFTYQDIDDTKNLEIELKEYKSKSENIYSHKASFLANMSHEIRTPLNGIIGMLTLLEDTSLSYDQKNFIDMLRECSINLMIIINDILDYSKLEAGKISLITKCIDIRDCIESTNDIILSKLHEKKLGYNCNISPIMPYFIKGDISRIKQILLNLLTNSLKFTEKGQIVLDVSAENIDIENSKDFFIKFSISDTGCGINKSERDKLFKSFSQIDNQSNSKIYQGTGLGLAISKELVTLMDGDIWIDWSEINKGSRFCFTIKTSNCDDIQESATIDEKIILRNKDIFILDDKLENRINLATFTEKWDMKVTTFSSEIEALHFTKSKKYDLGLVDSNIGLEFSNKLKQQLLNNNRDLIPLISLGSTANDILNYDFKCHLQKPITEIKLKQICIEILSLSKYKFKKETNDIKNNKNDNFHLLNDSIDKSLKGNLKILLVEDVLINQTVVVSFLQKMGFMNIDIADNGQKCLEMLCKKTYDVILLDIRMPILSGTDVIEYILEYYNNPNPHKNVKYKLLNSRKPYIMAVTAYCLKEDKKKYLDMGFDDYVPKPISINELSICMNKCIGILLKD